MDIYGKIALALAVLSVGVHALAEPASERTEVLHGGEGGYHTYRLPTLLCTQSGVLLLFCDGRKNQAGDIGKIDPVMCRSLDGGKTWQPMQVLHTDPGEKTKVGNGCPIYDRETNTVFFLFLKNLTQALLITSTDDGATFSVPRDVTSAFREIEYPWKYFATGHVHGIQLRTCRLVAPVSVNDVPRSGEYRGKLRNGIVYSDDHGQTWHAGGLLPYFHQLNESTVFEASDGSLCINSRGVRVGYRVVARSRDGGMSWTQPAIDKSLSCPTCQASTLTLPSGDGRHRVLFSNPASRWHLDAGVDKHQPDIPKSRTHLVVRLSYDDGRTWPVSKLLDSGGAGYSDMAVGPDGTIYLAYERSVNRYSDQIAVARFGLEWLTEGEDGL